jgi:alpha-L-rhamnosidase
MKAATQTPYGDVAAGWKAEGNTLKSLDVEIPFNTTATVKVPAPSKDAVTCSAGVAAVEYKDGCAIFNVGSGQYTFTVK